MCGRYALYSDAERVRRVFELSDTPRDLVPRYNIAPGQDVPVVRTGPGGGRSWALLRWGLVPPWSEGPRAGHPMINARAETAHARPAFRGALARRRCLLPADGFYEWHRAAGRTVPHFIRPRDTGPFAFAGLWEAWRGDGETLESVAILTTAANALVAPVHDRMPVILEAADHAPWLDPAVPGTEALGLVAAPFPAERLRLHRVGPAVNDARHEGPELIRPA